MDFDAFFCLKKIEELLIWLCLTVIACLVQQSTVKKGEFHNEQSNARRFCVIIA